MAGVRRAFVLLLAAEAVRAFAPARPVRGPAPAPSATKGGADAAIEEGRPVLNGTVYSLATLNEDGSTNLNIITFATRCSIVPKELWAVSVYKGTRTHANLMRTGHGVLQVLGPDHGPLMTPLGKQTGNEVDKAGAAAAAGFPLRRAGEVLPAGPRSGEEPRQRPLEEWPMLVEGCAGLTELHYVSMQDAGDHDLCLCEAGRVFKASGRAALDMAVARAYLPP